MGTTDPGSGTTAVGECAKANLATTKCGTGLMVPVELMFVRVDTGRGPESVDVLAVLD